MRGEEREEGEGRKGSLVLEEEERNGEKEEREGRGKRKGR